MNDRFCLDRRHLFKAALPAIGAMATTSSVSAPLSSATRIVSVADFGAKGDGRSDDGPAFAAALLAAQCVTVPPGQYRITAPITLRDGHVLQGVGRSGWEPYTGRGAPASAVKTEIVIDQGTAIDARNTNNVTVAGLALRARNAQQSRWAYEPGSQQGTTGVDIAGALQFAAQDVSFHGLGIGVSAIADTGDTAQMPVIDTWSAHDCATVFRFSSTIAKFAPVRDARIANCIAAVHCGRVVEARNCDGLRIENVRFFQCVRNALLIENTPFVSIIGATMFETGDETIVLRGCSAITMAGMQLVRAGFYHAPPPTQRAAVLLENCRDIAFDGLVERPMGRAFSIRNCHNLSIGGAISVPFWSTGSLGSDDGAVFIERSRAVAIHASFSSADYWIAVWADAESAPTVDGRIVVEGMAGVVRCVQLQPAPLGHVLRLPQDRTVPGNSTIQIDTLRLLVPPRGTLVSRSVELTGERVVVQAADQRWMMQGGEPGGGGLSLDRKILHRNDTATSRYASIPLGIHNPASQPVTMPAGLEVRLSLAIE